MSEQAYCQSLDGLDGTRRFLVHGTPVGEVLLDHKKHGIDPSPEWVSEILTPEEARNLADALVNAAQRADAEGVPNDA